MDPRLTHDLSHDRPESPLETITYPQMHRAGRHQWWRALVGLVAVALVGLLALPMLVGVAMALAAALTGYGAERFSDEIQLFPEALTPWSLAFGLLTIWCLIPGVWAAQRLVHWLPLGTVASVVGRIRWRYLAVTTGFAVLAMVVTMLVAALVPADEITGEASGTFHEMTATSWQFLAVIVLFVPIQAAAEEFAFRGYLMQAWGGVFGARGVATVVSIVGSSLIFALMHGAQEWPIFFDRFSFGVCAAVVVVLTGGLEAAIALHVVNNLFAFGVATLVGDVSASMTPSGSTWWQVPISLVQVLTFGALAVWWARRSGVVDRVQVVPGALARPAGVARTAHSDPRFGTPGGPM